MPEYIVYQLSSIVSRYERFVQPKRAPYCIKKGLSVEVFHLKEYKLRVSTDERVQKNSSKQIEIVVIHKRWNAHCSERQVFAAMSDTEYPPEQIF
jgi:hypothetical protein